MHRIAIVAALTLSAVADAADPAAQPTAAPASPVRVALPRSNQGAPAPGPSSTPSKPLAVVALESAPAPHGAAPNVGPQAGSLLAVPDPQPRAFHQHDLITIQVVESSNSTTHGKNKTEKKYDLDAAVKEFWNFNVDLLGVDATYNGGQLPSAAIGVKKKFDTKGDIERKDSLTARVTAEVVEVRPNGVLVLEAYRHIRNDDEEQTIRLAGECRPEDVDATNTVQSQRLANATVEKLTKGQVTDSSAKGILAQILDTVFAF